MNAKFVLLNHFSQRYPKIPVFTEKHQTMAAIAFDLMSITLNDFEVMRKMYPALMAIFQELEKNEKAEEETAEDEQPEVETKELKGKRKTPSTFTRNEKKQKM